MARTQMKSMFVDVEDEAGAVGAAAMNAARYANLSDEYKTALEESRDARESDFPIPPPAPLPPSPTTSLTIDAFRSEILDGLGRISSGRSPYGRRLTAEYLAKFILKLAIIPALCPVIYPIYRVVCPILVARTKSWCRLKRQYGCFAFKRDLTVALNTHSVCLSKLCRHKAAPEVIEEAVRQLAVNCPAAFVPDLAMPLHRY
jgi:hypothetical protein